MNMKQVFSMAAAAGLPALALCAYMYVAPTRALALSQCPDGEQYSPNPNSPGDCSNGEGGVVFAGQHGFFPAFCFGTPDNGGTCSSTGDQCVLCDTE